MKKILFVAIAVAGLSNLASAQEAAVSAKRAPAQDQQTADKASKAKVEASAAAAAPVMENPDAARSAALQPNSKLSLYTKAGLSAEQAVQMSSNMQEIDKRKAEIENNTALTPLQKKDAVEAIEAERTAILKKSMGPNGYKKYVELKAAGGKAKASN